MSEKTKEQKKPTVYSQLSVPMQSPVMHAAPFPFTPLRLLGPVPSSLNEQLVRPHTLPCQSGLTKSGLVSPGASSKPPTPGPIPFCVPTPGHIVSGQLLVITIGIGVGFVGVEVGCEVPFTVELGGIGTEEEATDAWLTGGGGFDVGVTAGGGPEALLGLTTGTFEATVVGTSVVGISVVGMRVELRLWAATPEVCPSRISRKPRAPLM